MDATRILLQVLFAIALLVLTVWVAHGQSGFEPATHIVPGVSSFSPSSEPQGAERCQFCHAAEVADFARSAMAHALRRAGQEPDGTVTTASSRITMRSSNDGYWQRFESGREVTDYRIDYVIGSGKHAAGYLLDVANHLFQSPVAYYNSRHAYGLAPGYESLSNPDFTRPVSDACLFCHSGSALKVPGTANEYRSPPFSPEAISCERCHGAVDRHLQDPRPGTIVNPAKLQRVARDSICEQCHLLGVGRVLNPGKKFSDFRPGEPLEEVFTTYRNVLPPGADGEKFKVISHVEQLARSVCAQRSNGTLWCGTCHDPHNQPLEPIAYFRSKCLSCHAGKLPASHPDEQSNCIGCHMPKRDAKDGGHTAFTDHRIQSRPDLQETTTTELDIAAWREPAPELQKRNLGIAYINVGMQERSRSFIGRGYRMLTEVQTQFADDSETFTALGSALLLAKQNSEAELAFERALQLDPNSVTAETNAASAYLQAGDYGRAKAHLERAVDLDPFHLPALEPLIDIYKQEGNSSKAEELSAKLNSAIEKQSDQVDTSRKSDSEMPIRTTESVYKNIQVLKGIPAEDLIPSMRFVAASLGVECNYCHVAGHFEKDDKKPKETARKMMRMVMRINGISFGGTREVTCNSCHHGSTRPESTPGVAGKRAEDSPSSAQKLSTDLPTVNDVIDRYVRALGGIAAIEQIKSSREDGSTSVHGRSSKIEVFNQGADRQVTVRHTTDGDSITVFDGHEGWWSVPGRPLREMRGAELDAARIDAGLHFPLHLNETCGDLRTNYPVRIGNVDAYVISCENVGKPPAHLYFDEQSGLLVRMVRYLPSPLGNIPTQIDYSDYRDIGGIKVPLRWTVAGPDEVATTQLERVEWNVPIDAIRFAKPAQAISPKPEGQ